MDFEDAIRQVGPRAGLVWDNPVLRVIIDQRAIIRPRQTWRIPIGIGDEGQLSIGDAQRLITDHVPGDDFVGFTTFVQHHRLIVL